MSKKFKVGQEVEVRGYAPGAPGSRWNGRGKIIEEPVYDGGSWTVYFDRDPSYSTSMREGGFNERYIFPITDKPMPGVTYD
jgi:hypothetical protein